MAPNRIRLPRRAAFFADSSWPLCEPNAVSWPQNGLRKVPFVVVSCHWCFRISCGAVENNPLQRRDFRDCLYLPVPYPRSLDYGPVSTLSALVIQSSLVDPEPDRLDILGGKRRFPMRHVDLGVGLAGDESIEGT